MKIEKWSVLFIIIVLIFIVLFNLGLIYQKEINELSNRYAKKILITILIVIFVYIMFNFKAFASGVWKILEDIKWINWFYIAVIFGIGYYFCSLSYDIQFTAVSTGRNITADLSQQLNTQSNSQNIAGQQRHEIDNWWSNLYLNLGTGIIGAVIVICFYDFRVKAAEEQQKVASRKRFIAWLYVSISEVKSAMYFMLTADGRPLDKGKPLNWRSVYQFNFVKSGEGIFANFPRSIYISNTFNNLYVDLEMIMISLGAKQEYKLYDIMQGLQHSKFASLLRKVSNYTVQSNIIKSTTLIQSPELSYEIVLFGTLLREFIEEFNKIAKSVGIYQIEEYGFLPTRQDLEAVEKILRRI